MNERIKELMEQAGPLQEVLSEIYGGTPGRYVRNKALLDFQLEKFAELMIKKFDGILLLEYIDCVGEQDKQAADRIARLRGKVETYFGAEL